MGFDGERGGYVCWNHRLIRSWQDVESKNHSRGNSLCMCVGRTGTCHVRRSAPAARHDGRRGLSQVHGLPSTFAIISQGARVLVPPWPEAHGATPRRIRCGDTALEGLAWLVFAQLWAFIRRGSYLACCRPSGGGAAAPCSARALPANLHPKARGWHCAPEVMRS